MRTLNDYDIREQHELLRSDPRKYLALADELVRQNPSDSRAYWDRYMAWHKLGRKDLALKDLNKSLELKHSHVKLHARGELLHALERYPEAIKDFDEAEALDPEFWIGSFGPLYRADCHARLGNEEAALADCARLPEKHWTPGLDGTPKGDKQQVIAEIQRRAAAAKRSGAART